MVTSRSRISGGRAYERYCAVAHTSWRPVVASSAVTAAPRPQPPKRKPACRTQMPRSTGSTQRWGLCVGRRPRNSRAVIVDWVKGRRLRVKRACVFRPGNGAIHLITGEPGIGKTRVASEFAREAAAMGTIFFPCDVDGAAHDRRQDEAEGRELNEKTAAGLTRTIRGAPGRTPAG